MLAAGGTAADAAVALASVLSVVEPWFSSVLGGGTWGIYFDAEAGEVTSLDGVGPIGSKATLEDYGPRAQEAGIHQANVPGSWDAWMLWLDRYGVLDLGDVLAPAIRIAREGFPVSSEMAFWLEREAEDILNHPDSIRVYAPEGELPVSGDQFTIPDLASTFEALAKPTARHPAVPGPMAFRRPATTTTEVRWRKQSSRCRTRRTAISRLRTLPGSRPRQSTPSRSATATRPISIRIRRTARASPCCWR